ncbi:protein MIZU-KUSSEI 1 [Cannabis sativa]|uniref:Protein MIZU-KUSSEI 1 n=1 Tax=Cannabis sativa TaxID=3483 RepID=A0A803QGR2_CANSA|nr:protein MIZU-KUSSEI 1 [Cannabis sativa]
MTKIDVLRRYLLPCFCPAHAVSTVTNATHTTKKRLSTSLRDDLPDNYISQSPNDNEDDQDSPSPSPAMAAQPRPSKSMVIGTIFGHRRGHVWFCIQHDRLSFKPSILLEFPILTHQLVNEMRFGLVRIALEGDGSDLGRCPLRSVPVWTMYCNGRKLGFAARRKASDRIRLMLKTMQSTTVGAGVMPSGFGSSDSEEIMYMRANYEHVVGNADSESFHLINPDECPGQELSVFLLRSANGVSH